MCVGPGAPIHYKPGLVRTQGSHPIWGCQEWGHTARCCDIRLREPEESMVCETKESSGSAEEVARWLGVFPVVCIVKMKPLHEQLLDGTLI